MRFGILALFTAHLIAFRTTDGYGNDYASPNQAIVLMMIAEKHCQINSLAAFLYLLHVISYPIRLMPNYPQKNQKLLNFTSTKVTPMALAKNRT